MATTTETTEKPQEEKTLARKINAWGFVILLVLVFLVFGPVASYLSWKSNTLEGANIAVKVLFAILAYFGNFLYILWFAIMKTIFPQAPDTVSSASDSFSPFSSPSPAPAAAALTAAAPAASQPAPAPAPAATRVDDLDDDGFFSKADNNAAPAPNPAQPNPNQLGGKKKLKMRRRK
jgi:hypothetical protein